jgi:hypothetical protein
MICKTVINIVHGDQIDEKKAAAVNGHDMFTTGRDP